jgi:hypothetical protein
MVKNRRSCVTASLTHEGHSLGCDGLYSWTIIERLM